MEEFRIRAQRTFYRVRDRVVAIISSCCDSGYTYCDGDRMTAFSCASIAGKPAIHHTLSRVLSSGVVCDTVVITRRSDYDISIIDYCRSNFGSVGYRLGPNDSLIEKIQEASDFMQAQVVIELFADQPFIDPHLLRRIIKVIKSGNVEQDSTGNFLFLYQDMIDRWPKGLQFRAIKKNYLDTILTVGSLSIKDRSLGSVMSRCSADNSAHSQFDYRVNDGNSLRIANSLYEKALKKEKSWKRTYLWKTKQFAELLDQEEC